MTERPPTAKPETTEFTHFDAEGRAVMVDVSAKATTERLAVARGTVVMKPETAALIESGRAHKGDVLTVAELAGIMGAKRTPDLIPLCHPLALTSVKVRLFVEAEAGMVHIQARCKITGRTGVEMEALTAVSVAALTVYDMCKSVDRGMQITDIGLVHKRGGRSGEWWSDDPAPFTAGPPDPEPALTDRPLLPAEPTSAQTKPEESDA